MSIFELAMQHYVMDDKLGVVVAGAGAASAQSAPSV
jgi:hypothetical protein